MERKVTLGKNMRHALAFAKMYGGWATFKKDRATKDAIKRLEALGMVEISGDQFKATPLA